MAPTYEAGYAHSEPFEPEYNNSNGNSNSATAYQYETYAMCNRCYTQQDCPHRHTTYQQQHGLNTGGYHGMMMMTPAMVTGYPRHDPPLSSVGVAFSNNRYNNVNRSQQDGSQQPVSSSGWYNNGVNNGVNKFANVASSMCTADIQQQQQQQQNLPYFGHYTGLGLGTMTIAPPEEEVYPHGLPDLLQRSATVAPSALERYPADDHTTNPLQAEQSSANQSQRHTTTTSSLATPSSSSCTSSSSFVSSCSSSSSSGPLMLCTQKPKPQITSEATYHRALYGYGPNIPGDPSSDRAIANMQILPTIAAQHGHPVWPLDTKAKKNTYLLEAKKRGLSYREIKEFGEISDAESTLRGRYRMLTKTADERVRRPIWEEKDVRDLAPPFPPTLFDGLFFGSYNSFTTA
jgi:hypothetical protein